MTPTHETMFRAAFPALQAYDMARATVLMLNGMIQQDDPAQLMLVCAAAATQVSFGEYITISIRPIDVTACEIHVRSQSAAPGALFDWGKNQQNVLAFQQAFSTLAATRRPAVPATWRDPFDSLDGEPRNAPEAGPPSNEPQCHLFISYRRSDSNEVVGRIYDRLVRDLGAESVFKDVDNIPLGVDFVDYLDAQVQESTALLAVIGPEWLTVTDAQGHRRLDDPNDFVRIEIESALRRDIPVVPVLVRGAVMPNARDLPESLHKLARRNGISVRADPDFHNDMTALIRKLLGP
jgi:hypothetical protein